MMENEFDYYVILSSNEPSVPLLNEDDEGPRYFHKKVEIENPELMKFKIGHPIPKKPVLADYLSTPSSVISKNIFNVLEPLNISGVQLIPAVIRDQINDKLHKDYWALHIINRIQCIDPVLSDCEIQKRTIAYVKKIVLDKKALEEIPLEERLVFRMKEHSSKQLFHTTIVDIIMSVNPTGIRFIPIEDYNDGTLFVE
ncbi:MAG: hypothetical protein MRY83_21615 [Flavobacteriales bacterium]|nr:hypothetical protein [Flavobacteriales bacterium]